MGDNLVGNAFSPLKLQPLSFGHSTLTINFLHCNASQGNVRDESAAANYSHVWAWGSRPA